jgi:hypothetical protein
MNDDDKSGNDNGDDDGNDNSYNNGNDNNGDYDAKTMGTTVKTMAMTTRQQ